MSKEIKFRAWNKTKKIMTQAFAITGRGSLILWKGRNGKTWDWAYGKSKKLLEIMQYTGIKDKNGEEIYSGDLLRHNEGSKEYEVMWNDMGFWELDGSCLGMVMRDNPNGLEIVGNIYENPELIK